MKAFIDSNVFVYALGDDAFGDIARSVMAGGGVISVQCLNEFAAVAKGKLKRDWADIELALLEMRTRHGPVIALDESVHADGMRIARRYTLSIYDSMMVAAALSAGCDTLFSQDMQDGLSIDGRLQIVNPFRPA